MCSTVRWLRLRPRGRRQKLLGDPTFIRRLRYGNVTLDPNTFGQFGTRCDTFRRGMCGRIRGRLARSERERGREIETERTRQCERVLRFNYSDNSHSLYAVAGETRSRFRRVRSHFVSSINSDHRLRTPQRTSARVPLASPLSGLMCSRRCRARWKCLLLAHTRYRSLHARPPRLRPARVTPAIRFYLSAVITPVTGIETRPGPALRIAEYRLSRGYCQRCLGGIPNSVGGISFAVHVRLLSRPLPLGQARKAGGEIIASKALLRKNRRTSGAERYSQMRNRAIARINVLNGHGMRVNLAATLTVDLLRLHLL